MAERKTQNTSRTPEGFVPKDQNASTVADDLAAQDAAQKERDQALQDQVDASTLEAAPADQMSPTGGSFHNPATVGSGTILPDGTYGSPLPDPNVERLAKLKDQAEKDSGTAK